MSGLQSLQFSFGRAGAAGKPFNICFDLGFPTQSFIHQWLSRNQLCDPPLVQALTEFLEPGDTFLDVGSHIGYYSLLALQSVGAHGRVFAFEPNPQTFSVLLANALSNQSGNFYACNCALGDQLGTAAFHINKQDEGMSSIVSRSGDAPPITVHVTTLDTIAAFAALKRVRMLKIDVEGFEENVIRGGNSLISSGAVESIVFEVNNNLADISKGRDLAIRRFLREQGYTSYLIRPWLAGAQWEQFFGSHNYYRLPESALEIAYGNVLATKRAIPAKV